MNTKIMRLFIVGALLILPSCASDTREGPASADRYNKVCYRGVLYLEKNDWRPYAGTTTVYIDSTTLSPARC